MIKKIEETKGVLAAQKVVLDLIEQRFGGAGAALGKTFGGQLDILRDRLHDVEGALVGVAAPTVTRGLTAVVDLVKKISAAPTTKAKFQVALAGGEELTRQAEQFARQLTHSIAEALARVDWRPTTRGSGR